MGAYFLKKAESPVDGIAVPEDLFHSPFEDLTNESRLLYAILLHLRIYSQTLVQKDDLNLVYVIYPREEAAKDIRVELNAIDTFFRELEDTGLITIRSRSAELYEVYVRNFASEL